MDHWIDASIEPPTDTNIKVGGILKDNYIAHITLCNYIDGLWYAFSGVGYPIHVTHYLNIPGKQVNWFERWLEEEEQGQ